MSNLLADLLEDAEKKLDKMLISTYTASHARTTSENRKLICKERKKRSDSDV
ncbi:hypothetical protein [Listeria floridensis]|uniref:hypothetical protein n=1 Tax=Listeria floridensis TaxID=1494962 RepID=UPI0004B71E63|nr:hypothetical protein [Listeria floridensis]